MINSVLAVENVCTDSNRATANNLDNNQPLRKKTKSTLVDLDLRS